MTFGSLFSGIGGMDLGLERAGMTCRWQVEIDEYANNVLAAHWPDVPRYRDVRTFAHERIDGLSVELIAGGFPCQDISDAGKRRGIDGERSGLWSEFARVVRVLRPRLVLVENVPALLRRGMQRVLGDLAACGYDAEWDCIPACAFGAHFRGDRVFIVAEDTAAGGVRRERRWSTNEPQVAHSWGIDEFTRLLRHELQHGIPAGSLGRISDGVSHRVDRLRGIGNAVVPQVAEWIGTRILATY